MKLISKILLFFFIFTASYSQDKKTEVENFYKSIIKTYFDKDCDKLYNSINDSVTIIGSSRGEIYSSVKIKQSRKMCNRFEQHTEKLISYENYIKNYLIFVLTKEEFTSNPESIIEAKYLDRLNMSDVFKNLKNCNDIYTSNDYFVIGKTNKLDESKDLFGAFIYIIRETPNGWKIFGTKR